MQNCHLLQNLVDVDLVGLNSLCLLLGSAGALGGFLDHLLCSWRLHSKSIRYLDWASFAFTRRLL